MAAKDPPKGQYGETPILKVRPATPDAIRGETPIPKVRPASKKG